MHSYNKKGYFAQGMSAISRPFFLVLVFISMASCITGMPSQDVAQHKLDIDCDGIEDSVYLKLVENNFITKIFISSLNSKDQLRFGLAQPERQDAICGQQPTFTTTNSDAEVQKELFGEVLEGYKSGSQCFDLSISGGQCDPITVFYNHKAKELNWWRQ